MLGEWRLKYGIGVQAFFAAAGANIRTASKKQAAVIQGLARRASNTSIPARLGSGLSHGLYAAKLNIAKDARIAGTAVSRMAGMLGTGFRNAGSKLAQGLTHARRKSGEFPTSAAANRISVTLTQLRKRSLSAAKKTSACLGKTLSKSFSKATHKLSIGLKTTGSQIAAGDQTVHMPFSCHVPPDNMPCSASGKGSVQFR